jgi:hypothetical protein
MVATEQPAVIDTEKLMGCARPRHCRRTSGWRSAARPASPGSATWSLGRAWLLPPRQRDAVQYHLRGQAVASALVRSSSQTGPGQSRRR